jgi:hypothetical protein
VIGSKPGGPLLATGMDSVTYHLPGPQWPDGRRGYIDGMVTDITARGRGHARTILGGLVAWLEESGIHFIQLHASPDGISVYKSAGFADSLPDNGPDNANPPRRQVIGNPGCAYAVRPAVSASA